MKNMRPRSPWKNIAPIPMRTVSASRFIVELLLGVLCVCSICAPIYAQVTNDSIAVPQTAQASPQKQTQSASNFKAVFSHGLVYAQSLENYTASGPMKVHFQCAEKNENLLYSVTIAKNDSGAMAIAIHNANDNKLTQKLISNGAQHKTDMYLPRETMPGAGTAATAKGFSDTLTLAMLMPLFEYFQQTKPDRWFSRLGEQDPVASQYRDGNPEQHLKFSFNYYFSLRDYEMELWMDDGETPLLRRVVVDLSKALKDRGFPPVIEPGTSIVMDLNFDTWILDSPPYEQDLASPGNPGEYEAIDLSAVLMANNGAMLSHFSLSGGLISLGSLPAGVPLTGRLPAMSPRAGVPSVAERAAIVSRMKNATPAERAQLNEQLKKYMQGSSIQGRSAHSGQQGTGAQRTQQVEDAARMRSQMGR